MNKIFESSEEDIGIVININKNKTYPFENVHHIVPPLNIELHIEHKEEGFVIHISNR